jgi:hypothetical protein
LGWVCVFWLEWVLGFFYAQHLHLDCRHSQLWVDKPYH